ncbi:hypothetical protein EVAR_89505_1 [Eumeta japonica]|uniref:Uncharacterized protein n=1 Tax=Eumeta variegata TaxID=151549 RepID=A0A4C1Y984_EUMVA|nr:hypothetical protein EVAR_89505_1 [Eumeta japonica]
MAGGRPPAPLGVVGYRSGLERNEPLGLPAEGFKLCQLNHPRRQPFRYIPSPKLNPKSYVWFTTTNARYRDILLGVSQRGRLGYDICLRNRDRDGLR